MPPDSPRPVDPETGTPAPAAPAPPARSPWMALAHLLKDAGIRWSDDNCLRLGAALAYYAVFSIFPLLLLAVTVVGFVLGDGQATRERLLDEVARTTSPQFRTLFDSTLEDMQHHQTARGVGTLIGVVTLVFGASGVFSELTATLNQIWRVPPRPAATVWHSLRDVVRRKALSLAVVVVSAVAILASLVATSVLTAIGRRVAGAASAATGVVGPHAVWLWLDAFGSMGLTTVVLSAMFKLIPDTRVAWRDVAGGALLTAVLFGAIKHLLAWYLAHLGSYAAYGAVGGFLCLLTWIYLASLFLFYGAEFARVYAERYGSLARAKAPAGAGQGLESSATSSGTTVKRSATSP